MTVLGNIFWLIVTLGVLVTIHEMGHFWVARRFGVKVIRFCVGFGKPIWSRYDKHGTEIAIAPIPLGGYVKLLDSRDCEISGEPAHEVYNNKPIYQRMLIMVAGPAFNFILAFVLYWLMFVVGKQEIQPTLGEPQKTMASAGFEYGDRLRRMANEEIKTWSDVSLALITAGIDRLDIEVEVETINGSLVNRILPLSTVPEHVSEEDLIDHIGLSPWRIPAPAIMAELDKNLPASQAGLRQGDEITHINGEVVNDWYGLVESVQKINRPPVEIRFIRSGKEQQITLEKLAVNPDDENKKVLGVRPQNPAKKDIAFMREMYFTLSYGPLKALGQAWNETGKITSKSLEMMWKLVTGKASVKNLSGPITIAQVANESAGRGFAWYLSFLALVSLSLGIINLMPVPMLDGGQMLFLAFEKIKGAPLSERFEIRAQMVGMFLLLSLMSVAFYNDILRSLS
ncbi:RIP metalloprotease RseP [Marinicella rhabdoformis]|uniref:RIP metalloprotease RseP n=1 Tax=Marinicella rhabdoformis TaxID=2580566 RepID=UPI0012AECED0|nr:RIP metalloprotease RseP [Marinicella rhabdoformis]